MSGKKKITKSKKTTVKKSVPTKTEDEPEFEEPNFDSDLSDSDVDSDTDSAVEEESDGGDEMGDDDDDGNDFEDYEEDEDVDDDEKDDCMYTDIMDEIEQQQQKQNKQNKEVTDEEEMITRPFLTRYEKIRAVATRAANITNGAKILIKGVTLETHTAKEIALLELKLKVMPFIIKRDLPNGEFERISINKLEDIND